MSLLNKHWQPAPCWGGHSFWIYSSSVSLAGGAGRVALTSSEGLALSGLLADPGGGR